MPGRSHTLLGTAATGSRSDQGRHCLSRDSVLPATSRVLAIRLYGERNREEEWVYMAPNERAYCPRQPELGEPPLQVQVGVSSRPRPDRLAIGRSSVDSPSSLPVSS